MELDFEWALQQETLLRSCYLDEETLKIVTRLLDIHQGARLQPFMANDLIRKASLKGQQHSDKPLPVSALEYLVTNHALNLASNKLTLSHAWFEGSPLNFDFIDPSKSLSSQLDKLTQRVELIYEAKEGTSQLRELIDRIAPLEHDHHKRSRFTILLPKQPLEENIELTRNTLTWDSYIIPVNHDSDVHLITRIIVIFQLLGLYNPDTSKGSTLNDLIALIAPIRKTTFQKDCKGKSFYPLDLEVADLLDEYPNDDIPSQPYLNYRLKPPIDFSVIRSDKFSIDDQKATDNDLKKTRFALTNLITHTGGVSITFDIENAANSETISLATPSIAAPAIWVQGIRAIRPRNKPPKKDKVKAEVHTGVASSLDQSISHPVDTIIHSLPDVNDKR